MQGKKVCSSKDGSAQNLHPWKKKKIVASPINPSVGVFLLNPNYSKAHTVHEYNLTIGPTPKLKLCSKLNFILLLQERVKIGLEGKKK